MATKKITNNIWFHELVPKQYLINKKEITDYDVRCLDIKLLSDIQKIREHFNRPLIINDGKQFNWRGLRTKDFSGYSETSMHNIWRAYDFHIDGVDVEEVRQFIINKRDSCFQNISAIEDKVNWIHVDSRYRPDNKLYIFNP